MPSRIHRIVTFLAVPAVTAGIAGAAAIGVAGVASAETNAGPNNNVVRSPTVHEPGTTAPRSGLSIIEHSGHGGGPSIGKPKASMDMSTYARSDLTSPSG